jgi:hypothetical protein
VFFFAPPAGDARFGAGALPGWADFNNGDIFYGMPDLEGRGFKIAHDKHGRPSIRIAAIAWRRRSLGRCACIHGQAISALAGAQCDRRACMPVREQLEWRSFDRPASTANNVLLVGAGSGHGFKHGPEIGRYASELLSGD